MEAGEQKKRAKGDNLLERKVEKNCVSVHLHDAFRLLFSCAVTNKHLTLRFRLSVVVAFIIFIVTSGVSISAQNVKKKIR